MFSAWAWRQEAIATTVRLAAPGRTLGLTPEGGCPMPAASRLRTRADKRGRDHADQPRRREPRGIDGRLAADENVSVAENGDAPASGCGARRPDAQSAATAMSENRDASRMLPTTTRASVIMELLHVRARRSARAHRINAPLAIPA